MLLLLLLLSCVNVLLYILYILALKVYKEIKVHNEEIAKISYNCFNISKNTNLNYYKNGKKN